MPLNDPVDMKHQIEFFLLRQRFAQLLEQGKLFVSDVDTAWICLNCGHVHHGRQAPVKCPVCQHSQGYFIRLELSPYEK